MSKDNSPRSTRRRRLALVASAIAVLLLAALYAPTAAFHLLPARFTGEADRLAAVLSISPGQRVAEIGAGAGAMTADMARRVGPEGRVYSTELSPERRDEIRARVERESLRNVVIVEAGAAETNLPDACCDAILMRNVYHHITDTRPFTASVRRAVRDGGRLAIVDFAPGAFWHLPGRPAEATVRRTGHGVSRRHVIDEFTAVGFRVEQEIEDWGGRMFLVLFRAAGLPD